MSKQVRVALVLAAVGIVASVVAEWAVRHLTERGTRTTSKLRCRVGRATLASAKLAATQSSQEHIVYFGRVISCGSATFTPSDPSRSPVKGHASDRG